MDEKKSFVLYTENAEQINLLSDEQAGKLIKAIFSYSETGIAPEFDDGMLKMAFSFIKSQLDRNCEKWEETRKKRAEAGRKGGKQSQANASCNKQTQANQANASFAKQTQANQANASFAKQTQANQANASFAKQTQANQAVNVNVNDNVNVNVNNIPPIVPQGDKPVKKAESDSFSESFEEFWKAYPRKVAKANAFKAWNKLKPDDNLVREILTALEKEKHSSQWQKDNGDFIPYPATWLNGRRWEDEITSAEQPPQKEYSFNLDDYKSLVNNFGGGESA